MLQQNQPGLVAVQLVSGERIVCANRSDAELVLDADRRFYEGNSGRKLPKATIQALERAGLHANNSMLYRSALDNVE